MANKFRLQSPIYERETETEKIDPYKIFFLSVEGNLTEKEYFEKISLFRERLGINVKVDVEVLQRSNKDTNSAPKHVIELLEEYVFDVREKSDSDIIDKVSPLFKSKYSKEFIGVYLNNPDNLLVEDKKQFLSDLLIMGYDLNYRKYLAKYNNEGDQFCIVIDRDWTTHSEKNMYDCIKHCEENGYLCFISNPCFEFWLLMHLCDINEKYVNDLDKIKCNAKMSQKHTYVSKEVWTLAGHGKAHLDFENNYLPKVLYAIEQAKKFETDKKKLVNNIGTNIGELIEKMKQAL